MKTGLLLLPSLAAIAYSAALPLADGEALNARDADDLTLTVYVTAASLTSSSVAPIITLTKTVTASKKTTTSTSKKPTTTAAPAVTVYKTITDILPSTVYVTTTDDGGDDGDDSATTTLSLGGITLGGFGPPWWHHLTKRQILELGPVTIDEPSPTAWWQSTQDVETTTETIYETSAAASSTSAPYHHHHHTESDIQPSNVIEPPTIIYETIYKRSPQTLDFASATDADDNPWYAEPTALQSTVYLSWLTLAKKSPKTEDAAAADCAGKASPTTAAGLKNLIPALPFWREPTAVTVTVTSYIYQPTNQGNQAPFTAKRQDALDMISRTLLLEQASSSTSSSSSSLSSSSSSSSSGFATSTKASKLSLFRE
jgi:hypothetical protein